MWEIYRYDWTTLRAAGTAAGVPAAIMKLVAASNEAEADQAYWNIDNTVVVQGALHESSLATARCLVVGLQDCSTVARPRVLELLVQLAGGEPSPEEQARGGASLAADCSRELYLAAATLLCVLETGTPEEQGYCVDLLGLCARQFPGFRNTVRWYLSRYAERALDKPMRQLVGSWISELQADA